MALGRLGEDRDHVLKMMTAAAFFKEAQDRAAAAWTGGFHLLAFLFAPPDSGPMRMLDARGDYFDVRSGQTWDLFFPGYYRSDRGDTFESECGARPVGTQFARDWYFSPMELDSFRRKIETESAGRWQYSGEADLVIANAYLPDVGDLTVDWNSVRSGQLTDTGSGTQTLTLASVVEKISQDIEGDQGDESYGVGAVVSPLDSGEQSHSGREFTISVLSQLTASLAGKPFGF